MRSGRPAKPERWRSAKALSLARRASFANSSVIVSDPNTMAAAGGAVSDAFHAKGHATIEPFLFADPDLYAEHRFVEKLQSLLQHHSAIPVAIGSGTINDLTKLAAHRTGRPYLCVAAAASMDGYTAFGASITHEGSKQTFECPAPVAVVADLDVIAAAPVEMNAWGYADLLAKVTAGADWILADALGVEPLDALGWDVVQGGLRDAVADPAGVRSRTLLSGWGLGSLVQRSGWNVGFGALLAVGAIGMFMFILAWPAKAHGYAEAEGRV